MKTQKKSQPLDITVFGMDLKVFRIGHTPGIKYFNTTANKSVVMKSVHTHFTYEVFFVTQGTLELVTEESTGVYERKILIIPPKIPHYSTPSQSGSFCLLFSFEQQKRSSAWQQRVEQRLKDGICQIELSADAAFYIQKIAEKCVQEDKTAEKEAQLLATLLFYEIFSGLFPEGRQRQFWEKGSEKHIYEIEWFINSHLKQKISLADVAQHICLSTRQVSRIIAKEYGCSFADLVANKKLTSAEMLIKNTNIPVGEIAAQANLGSANYFYTLFKKHYGISPLQYRKRYRNKKDRRSSDV